MSAPVNPCIHAHEPVPRQRVCALGLHGGRPHPGVCGVCPTRNRVTGPGDAIARVTQALGIAPCAPCQARQARLNAWWRG